MNTCPQCQSELNSYPAGISRKTGKPYSARVQCSNSDCDYVKWEPKPKTPQKANNGQKMAIVEVIYELQAIRGILERIENAIVEKAMQKKYGSQIDPNEKLQIAGRKTVNTVDGEPAEDIPVSQIPF